MLVRIYNNFLSNCKKYKPVSFLVIDNNCFRLVLALLLILFSFPALLEANGIGVDPSWHQLLHYAKQNHWCFGKDILFTYGPLGFIVAPLTDFNDILLTNSIRLSIYALWWLAAIKILYSIDGKRYAFAFFLIVITSCVYRDIVHLLFTIIIFYLFISYSSKRLLWAIPVFVIAAVSLLIKFNIGFFSLIFTVFFVFIYSYKYGVRNLFTLSVFCIGYIAIVIGLFTIFSGPVIYFIPFVKGSWELSKDYASNMALPLSMGSLIFFLAISLAVVALLFKIKLEKKDALFILVIVGLSFFFSYKSAFVHGDKWHLLNFFLFVGPMAAVLLTLPQFRNNKSLEYILSIQLIAILWLATHFNIFNWLQPSVVFKIKDAIAWTYSFKQVQEKNEKERILQRLPDNFISAVGNKTIEVYPNEMCIAFANKLNFTSRYVIQSYSSYNPYLDSISSLHFINESAPDFVLMNYFLFEELHPLFQDVRTFNEIWNNYTLCHESKEYLLLKKKKNIKFKGYTVISSGKVTENETITVPENDMIFLKANLGLSLIGKLVEKIYKVDCPSVQITYGDGTQAMGEILWKNMAEGCLISNVPRNTHELALLFNNKDVARVKNIKFVYNVFYYNSEIPITIEKLTTSNDK